MDRDPEAVVDEGAEGRRPREPIRVECIWVAQYGPIVSQGGLTARPDETQEDSLDNRIHHEEHKEQECRREKDEAKGGPAGSGPAARGEQGTLGRGA